MSKGIPNHQVVSAGISEYSGESKYHGKKSHPLYGRWLGIKKRCVYEWDKQFKNYGGRGIYVCAEWLHDFKPFYDWCMENGYSPELQIDRIDNDGPYATWNCRFVTHQINSMNKNGYGSSKYVGVAKAKEYFIAAIHYNYKTIFQRKFKLEMDAVTARDIFIAQNNLSHKMNFPENRNLYLSLPVEPAFNIRK